jgi:hypothetical protein
MLPSETPSLKASPPDPPVTETRRKTIDHLARQLRGLEHTERALSTDPPRSTGFAPLDKLLPGGGVRPGMLWEWLSTCEGSGAGTLMLLSGARLVAAHENLVVIDPSGTFYPPAAVRLGFDLQRTVVVQPARERDTLWALEQALRCQGVAVTICWLQHIDDRTYRRLQLATEQGEGVGLLGRPAKFLDQPSWADVRFQVRPLQGSSQARRLRLERLRCRGARGPRHIELELDDETGAVRLVTELAPPTIVARAARA